MKIVVHSNAAWGGIVDYMIQQAIAMADAGCNVVMLVPENFDKTVDDRIAVRPLLPNFEYKGQSSKLIRRLCWGHKTLNSWKKTAVETAALKPDVLLLSAYAEYLSPLWQHHLSNLRRRLPKLQIGAFVHDPVRSPIGPKPLHQYSVRCAYGFLDRLFCHAPHLPDQGGTSPPIPVTTVPFGPCNFPNADTPPKTTRQEYGIPENAPILLAFGHIRDSKNLHLAIRMLNSVPDLRLLVAGKVTSSRDKPASYYRSLAEQEGVGDRVVIADQFIPDHDAANLFEASDVVLLSYNHEFVSASSVLHVALKFRKPVLASSGEGHLKWAVEKYNLGIWVEPNSVESMVFGMNQLLSKNDLNPRWVDYERENTWEENARLVISSFSSNSEAL